MFTYKNNQLKEVHGLNRLCRLKINLILARRTRNLKHGENYFNLRTRKYN